MPFKDLSKISTQWTRMEDLLDRQGPEALADYLAYHYFEALALKLKAKSSYLDELHAHELASDVIFEFIKNDYRTLKGLDRNRGHLRGLFFTIIRRKLSNLKTPAFSPDLSWLEEDKETDPWVDFYLDLEDALEKLEKDRPRIHKTFVLFYLEGRKISEIAEILNIKENAIKNRLYNARQWLAENLRGYGGSKS